MRANPVFTGFDEFASAGDKTEPSSALKASGFLPLEMLPAQIFNWLLNRASKGVVETETYVDNINKELNSLLTAAGLSPDNSTSQVMASLKRFHGYDYIVDSDASLQALVESSTGAYTNVLIKKGTWSYTLSVSRPIIWDLEATGTQRIFAEPGSVLVFDSSVGASVCIGRSSWAELWENREYSSIENLHVYFNTATNYSVTGFQYVSGLTNCTYSYKSTAGLAVSLDLSGFLNCAWLSSCAFSFIKANGTSSTGILRAFNGCSFLRDCTMVFDKSEMAAVPNTYMQGFVSCSNLTNCRIVASGNTYARLYYGFYNCKGLSSCSYDGDAKALSGGYAFNACKSLSSCTVSLYGTLIASVSGVFTSCTYMNSCFLDVSSLSMGANTFVGFSSCSILSSCYVSLPAMTISGDLVGFSVCTDMTSCGISANAAIPSSGISLYGYTDCMTMTSCYAYFSSIADCAGQAMAFSLCSYLSGCRGQLVFSGTCSLSQVVFGVCKKLSSCLAQISHTYTSDIAVSFLGMDSCTLLSSCSASVTGARTTQIVAGFSVCSHLSVCEGQGYQTGAGPGYGYYACKQVQQCTKTVSASKTSTFNTSYADQGTTNACANTAAGGYNLP